MKNFIASIRAGKLVNDNLNIIHGYNAAVLAQLGNASYQLGKKMSTDEIKERLSTDKAGLETFENFVANLEANTIDLKAEQVTVGPSLGFDPQTEKFTGEFAAEAEQAAGRPVCGGLRAAESRLIHRHPSRRGGRKAPRFLCPRRLFSEKRNL